MAAKAILKRFLILPPIALGVLVVVLVARGRPGPALAKAQEPARVVRVLVVQPRPVVPRVVGFGPVQPARVWRAVAEVSGRVVALHPKLSRGEILPAGAELIRIDDVDYRLRIAQIEAEIRASEAQRSRLAVSERNLGESLAIEKRSLELAERELARLQELLERSSAPASDVDGQARRVLTQRGAVVGVENQLRLLPAERAVLDAQIAAARAQLDQARRDAERTRIEAPFDCRIASLGVEETQFVSPGVVMAEADGIAVAEVVAQLSFDELSGVVRSRAEVDVLAALREGRIWEELGLEALVRLRFAGRVVEWPARFARAIDVVDPQTRTVGIVVAVENPYARAEIGARPPLVKGMFLEVELRARPLPDQLVVPRSAVHGGRVHVADENDRLAFREVELGLVQFDEACVASGLAPGDRVVLSDLPAALEGMLLAPLPPE